MRVAAIYDIHGNLPALEAVLQEIRQMRVDLVVVGGDVVRGPMRRECLSCLLDFEIPTQFIQGNGEVAVLAHSAGANPGSLPEQARQAVRWSAEQLSPEFQSLIASWRKTLRLDLHGLGDVLFCHATPRNENECFTRLTLEDRLLPVFDGVNESLVICGHTHMQFDRMVGRTRVVNAGSVGMPFGEPGAYWLLLGPDVQPRRTRYELTNAAERIRGTNYPQAEEFAARNVMQPPSEQAMLEVFKRVELR
jgi:Icc-related predicted phosphoesterase